MKIQFVCSVYEKSETPIDKKLDSYVFCVVIERCLTNKLAISCKTNMLKPPECLNTEHKVFVPP